MTQPINRETAIALAKEVGFKASVGQTVDDTYHPDRNAIGKSVPVEWVQRFYDLAVAHSRKDAEPVAGLLKPPSMAESGDKTVVDMSRLPKFHDDEAADYLSRAYKLSKQLTDHLSVSPSQRKNLTAIGWCRVGVIGSETLPFTITQVPRVAEIWREQGLEVLEVFTHPPEADKLLQQALEANDLVVKTYGLDCLSLPARSATAIRTYLEGKK